MIKNCRVCKKEFEPNNAQIRISNWICLPCRRVHDKGWRKKRIKLGLSTGGVASKEWIKKYVKEYTSRPYVKKRRAELMRKYRNDPALRMKHSCRDLFGKAIKKGIIKREPCSVCGNTKVDGHHEDYFKPLEVMWLCRKHHAELHARKKLAERSE